MSIKTISLDLDSANLLWLQAQAIASGRRNLSQTLNEVLERVRTGGRTVAGPDRALGRSEGAILSVRGMIRLPESDPDLKEAKLAVRESFRRSVERTAGFLGESDEEDE
ncbi:MAG: hypothetical protein GY856_39825 [bacterium]|nr:hypothetical protein [bacterium]